jgi:hypothetical protein
MEKVDSGLYRVESGEEITVQVTGHGVINSAAVFCVDSENMSEDKDHGTYVFTVTKVAKGSHFGELRCRFPGAGEDAKFTTRLSGSKGGSFPGPTVRVTTHVPVRDFEFAVV